MKPFQQLAFDAVPAVPNRPHGYFDVPHRSIEVDSKPFGPVRIHVREAGDGEPLLLIHGLMTTSYSWRYVIEPLAQRFRVIAPDLVGCGASDKPVVDYSVENVARFVAELQEALGVRGCRVVGNSMGGYVCMRLAQQDPAAMSKLVNIHSPGLPMFRLHALKTALALPGSEVLFHWLIRRDPLRWAHTRVHYWDESVKSLEEAHAYGDPLAKEDGRTALSRYLRDTMAPAGIERFVAELRRQPFPVPLRLIYARRDPMVPPEVGTGLHALVPEAELIWLDRCSHFAHVDRPEKLVELIAEFAS